MAGNMTNYLEKKLLDHALGVASYTMPTGVYVGLFSADPTETGAGATEITGNGYARQSIVFNPTTSGAGTTDNSNAPLFPIATGSWGTVSHFVLFDAVTGGNPLFYGPFGTPKTVGVNDRYQVPTGNLDISLD